MKTPTSIDILGILFLFLYCFCAGAFIGIRIAGIIQLSWWIVLIPIYVPVGCIALGAFIFYQFTKLGGE